MSPPMASARSTRFYLTDLTGDKIAGGPRLKAIEKRLLEAAAGTPMKEAA